MRVRVYRWNDWWFEVAGRGISLQPLSTHFVTLAERTGRQKCWHVAGHAVTRL